MDATKDDNEIIFSKSHYEDMLELRELFDGGIITQDEFDAKKKSILDL